MPTVFDAASIIFSSWPKSSAHCSPSHRTVMPLCGQALKNLKRGNRDPACSSSALWEASHKASAADQPVIALLPTFMFELGTFTRHAG